MSGELDLNVTGHNEDDGETITVTVPGGIGGVFSSRPLNSTQMRISPDGAVMRYLMGELGTRVPVSPAGTGQDPA
jgi:hypothetical protein